MNTLKCINTPAVSAVRAARTLFATRALSSSAVVAQNVRGDLKQAANRDSTWSENQVEKKLAFRGPRFENTDIDAQVPDLHLGPPFYAIPTIKDCVFLKHKVEI